MKIRKKLSAITVPDCSADRLIEKVNRAFEVYENYPSRTKMRRLSVRRRKALHLPPFRRFGYSFKLNHPSFPNTEEGVNETLDALIDAVVEHGGFCCCGYDFAAPAPEVYEIYVDHNRQFRYTYEYSKDEVHTLGAKLGAILKTDDWSVTKHDSFWNTDEIIETIK